MTTPMRWADSDSEDSEEDYKIGEEKSSEAEEAPEPEKSFDKKNDNSHHQRQHNQHSSSSFDSRNQQRGGQQSYGGGGNYGGGGGGGKNRPQQQQQRHPNQNRGGPGPENWKQLAKASSRFSSDSGNNKSGNIDGSAWMAQRRAKMEQGQKVQKQKEAERIQQTQEEKQSRRKSQMNALKAAMTEIKIKQEVPPQTSSLGVAAASNSQVQILKKEHSAPAATKSQSQPTTAKSTGKQEKGRDGHNEKDDASMKGSWRRSKPSPAPSKVPSHPSSPTAKYSYTIGPSPSASSQQDKKIRHEAELQPDRSSVKFTRNRSSATDDKNSTSDSKAEDTKGQGAVPAHHKTPTTNDTVDNNMTKDAIREHDRNKQKVIVAFDDASGHPSSGKKNKNKTKKNKQNKIGNNDNCDDSEVAATAHKSKMTRDDHNDEDVASTKTSSSRGSSTLHSSSRSSRGGGKHIGGRNNNNNAHRRDSRNSKSGGRGRGREGRGSQQKPSSHNKTSGSSSNEGEGCGNHAKNDKRGGATQDANRGGRVAAGREGNRRDSGRGRGGRSSGSGKDEVHNNGKGNTSGGRGHTAGGRGNSDRGGRGRKAGRGGRGGQRNSGKDSSSGASPKYSYEIGKD